MYIYRRKYGRYLTFGRKSIINGPTPVVPRRYRHRGVWRPGQSDEGLPGYTIEAKDGEMSLGVGRKRTDEEEYELEDHVDRTSGESGSQEEIEREARHPSVASIASARDDGGERPSTRVAMPPEMLPPYIPPPSPALLADSGFGRIASRRNSASSMSGRRGSFPRIQLPSASSRRGSRAERGL